MISHGRLALCSATKILLAFISRAAGSTDITSRKSAIEEKMFWKVTLSSALIFFCKRYLHVKRHFLKILFAFETVSEVFPFQTVGRVIVPDIIFRGRTCLVFCFLGCVVKFQAREANSWPRSASSNPGNRVCVLFVFLSFSLSFSFPPVLLLAFFLVYLYLSS